jgi:3-phenylpropionate/trans-cinnamate dioxygenase ferredoxin component
MPWIDACSLSDLDAEGARRFDKRSRTLAIYRNHQDGYFCTDGFCTHKAVHLADSLVIENTISCPKHSSIFDFSTGEVETPLACESLRTYPTKVENGRLLVEI